MHSFSLLTNIPVSYVLSLRNVSYQANATFLQKSKIKKKMLETEKKLGDTFYGKNKFDKKISGKLCNFAF